LPKFNKKLVSKIRVLREELKISQQELAKSVGVSRQTIYYLERGISNPSLTLSMDISKVLKKSIEEIFFYEPVIKDILGEKTLEELDEIAEITGIDVEKIMNLRKINDKELSEAYTEEELRKIAETVGLKFHDLFSKDDEEF
jgi:putative transcriptional regulator